MLSQSPATADSSAVSSQSQVQLSKSMEAAKLSQHLSSIPVPAGLAPAEAQKFRIQQFQNQRQSQKKLSSSRSPFDSVKSPVADEIQTLLSGTANAMK
jgi:hypothetical protein